MVKAGRRKIVRLLLGAGAGAATFSASKAAHAWGTSYRDLTGMVIRYVVQFYLPWLYKIIELIDDYLSMLTQYTGGQGNAGIAQTGDQEIEAMVEIENQRIKREAPPGYESCSAADSGQALTEHAQAAELASRRQVRRLTCIGRGASPAQATAWARQRVAEHEQARERALDLAASTLLSPIGYSEEEKQAASRYVRNVLGDLHLKAASLPGEQDGQREVPKGRGDSAANRFVLVQEAFLSRFSVAAGALYDLYYARVRNARLGARVENSLTGYDRALFDAMGLRENGVSKLDLLEFEVARTWGNPEWMEYVNGMAGHAPVAKAHARVMALREMLEGELLRQQELIATLHAVLGLNDVEPDVREKARTARRAEA